MTTMDEELSKAAPGQLAMVQALVNTQYGQGRRAHIELMSPEQLRAWLVARRLLADGTPVTQGDFRRVLQLREALRSLLRANNEREMPSFPLEEDRSDSFLLESEVPQQVGGQVAQRLNQSRARSCPVLRTKRIRAGFDLVKQARDLAMIGHQPVHVKSAPGAIIRRRFP